MTEVENRNGRQDRNGDRRDRSERNERNEIEKDRTEIEREKDG